MGEHTLHVYHIYAGGSGWGLAERNAGDSLGDLSFIFPRGFQAYYKGGYVAMVHASYNHWHKYLQCNHNPGSHTYSCNGGSYEEPGRESVSASHGSGHGYWYSFPRLGKDKHWWESHSSSGVCGYIRISAKCLFNLMAKAGGRCSHGCDGKAYDECSKCMGGLSLSHEHQIWDHAIWNHGCHRYTLNDDLNATVEFDDPVMPEGFFTNTSHPDVSRDAIEVTAPTDQGFVVV